MQTIYKLKSLICYTGNHYFTYMRVITQMTPDKFQWILFNDSIIESFKDWNEVVTSVIDA